MSTDDAMTLLTSAAATRRGDDDFAWPPPPDECGALDLERGQAIRIPLGDDDVPEPRVLDEPFSRRFQPAHSYAAIAAVLFAAVIVLESAYLIFERVQDDQPALSSVAATAALTPGVPTTNPPIALTDRNPAPALRSPKSAAPVPVPAVSQSQRSELPPRRDREPTPIPSPRPAETAIARGSVSIALPFIANVYEDGRLLAASDAERIVLAPGRHELELVNDALNYRSRALVEIESAKPAFVRPIVPIAVLQVNASPWAEVLVDGQSVGETPLGNVKVSIGPHQVTLRHPELGEQTRTVVIAAGAANRLSVDLGK